LLWVIRNQRLSPFNDCGSSRGAFLRVTLSRWHIGTSLAYSKAVYFVITLQTVDLGYLKNRIISVAEREDFRWSRLFDYTPHLVSISPPFWECDCLLKASGFLGRQQSLAEAQYSGKLKLKFVWILVTYLVYLCIKNMWKSFPTKIFSVFFLWRKKIGMSTKSKFYRKMFQTKIVG